MVRKATTTARVEPVDPSVYSLMQFPAMTEAEARGLMAQRNVNHWAIFRSGTLTHDIELRTLHSRPVEILRIDNNGKAVVRFAKANMARLRGAPQQIALDLNNLVAFNDQTMATATLTKTHIERLEALSTDGIHLSFLIAEMISRVKGFKQQRPEMQAVAATAEALPF